MRLFVLGMLLTFSEARRRFSSDKEMNKFLAGVNRIKRLEKKSKIRLSEDQIFEKLNAEFPVNTILDKYNTSIAYVTNIIKESRKNSIYQRSGSFDTLADSAQAVMAVLVGVGPPPPPLPSFDEIQRKFVWNSWQSWSACSETCGIGTRTRMRSCSRPTRVCEKFLDTKARETRRCRDQPCASWSNWANWTTCSKSCGEGVSIRRRQCSGNYCPGSSMSNRKCSVAACPARGVSADWEEWSSCNSCSIAAKQMRKRECAFKSTECPSPPLESRSCSLSTQCKSVRAVGPSQPVATTSRPRRTRATSPPTTTSSSRLKNSSTGWSEWSSCNASCGRLGFRTRTRPCTWKPRNCHKFKSKATERCFRRC